MIETVITSFLSFVGTNIDDIFVLMLLFAQVCGKKSFFPMLFGRYLAMLTVLAISFLGAFGLSFISADYIKFLGFLPIFLGIKAIFEHKNEENQNETKLTSLVWSTTLITLANSADNIGVYIPLFTGYTWSQVLITVAVFLIMTFLWHVLGMKLASLPFLKKMIEQYKIIAVPVIYILLGLYILIF